MKTHIDWVTFRTKTGPYDVLEALRPAFGPVAELVTLVAADRGRDGWEHGKDIVLAGDIRLGQIDYGGHSQREWVRVILTGEGCGWVDDWLKFTVGMMETKEAEFRRVDIALTTYAGEVSHQRVLEAVEAGKFTTVGRAPNVNLVGCLNDPRAGKTVYVGSRSKSDKFLRCYEKGFEMIKSLPESERIQKTHIGPDRIEDIYRVELELKPSTKEISLNVLMHRDEVFASAYPFCAELLPGLPHYVRKALPDDRPVATLAGLLAHCKAAYGAVIFTALQVYGDREKVLALITGTEHSKTLVEAGALTI